MQSDGIQWEEDGEIALGFDESLGRLIIKKDQSAEYGYSVELHQMKDCANCEDRRSPLRKKYEKQIRSVIVY